LRRYCFPIVAMLAALLLYLAMEKRGAKPFPPAPAASCETLLRLDAEFDRAVAEKGVEGWVSYFAEDGAMLPAGDNIVKGKEAIRQLMAGAFAAPGYSLRWKPLGADLSGSEDLGYTYGTYVSTGTGADGEPVTRHGKYVTVWKEQEDRSWKVVLDIGNASPPPEGTSSE